MDKKGAMGMYEIVTIIILIALLVWLLFFNTSLGGSIGESLRGLFRLGR